MKSDWEVDQMRNYSLLNKTLRNSATTFLYLLIWNLVTLATTILKSRQEQLDKMKLETTVKIGVKAIKSHINPHFIFNALDSIRALVDENPGRARTAITGCEQYFAQHAGRKNWNSSFWTQVNIVKDYHEALEQIRFEDRLVVDMI